MKIRNPFTGLNFVQKVLWWWTVLFIIPTAIAGIVYNVHRHDRVTVVIIAVYLALMFVLWAGSFATKSWWCRSSASPLQ